MASARAAVFTFLSERFPAGATPSSRSSQPSSAAILSSFAPLLVSSSPFNEPVPAASLIISAMPIYFPQAIPAAIIAVTRSVSTVTAMSAGILTHTLPAMDSYVPFPVLLNVPTTAIASSVLAFPMVSFSAPVTTATVPVF